MITPIFPRDMDDHACVELLCDAMRLWAKSPTLSFQQALNDAVNSKRGEMLMATFNPVMEKTRTHHPQA